MALIEGGKTPFQSEIIDVLNHSSAGSVEARRVVNRLRKGVQNRRRNAPREPPREAHLPGIEDRIGAIRQIIERRGVGNLQGAGLNGGSRGRAVRLLVDGQIRPLRSDVFRFDHQSVRQCVLNGEVPGLRV